MKILLIRLLEAMNLMPVIQKFSLLLLALLLMFSTPSSDYTLNKENFNDNALKQIEEDTKLKFPKGTFGINMYCKQAHRLEARYWAKIGIPSESLNLLLEQLKKIQNGNRDFFFRIYKDCSEQLDWWKPSNESAREIKFYEKVIVWLCKEEQQWILYVWFNAR